MNALLACHAPSRTPSPGNCRELPDFLREVREICSAALEAKILADYQAQETSMALYLDYSSQLITTRKERQIGILLSHSETMGGI
jgi:hypothetical protein